MTQSVWSVGLLLTCCAALGSVEVKAVRCGDDVTLECYRGDNIPYWEITWYKANKEIVVTLGTSGHSRPFVSQRVPPASFGKAHGLLLPQVTPEDAGTYQCAVIARPGHKNHDHRVNLSVEACPTEAPQVFNTTSTLCTRPTHTLPTMWTIIGYLAVGATKVALSFICILICRGVNAKCAGQRGHRGSSST